MALVPRIYKQLSTLSFIVPAIFLISCIACSTSSAAAQKQTIGKVTVVYKHFTYSGNTLTADGGVTVSSTAFNLDAQTVVLYFDKTSTSGLSKATAEGNPARGTQVVSKFNQVILKRGTLTKSTYERTYVFVADHAVYKPDSSHPDGGTVDFTGNVTMTVTDPDSLAEPSTTTMSHATVTLGVGPDYPQIDGDDGQTVLTPISKSTDSKSPGQ